MYESCDRKRIRSTRTTDVKTSNTRVRMYNVRAYKFESVYVVNGSEGSGIVIETND